MINIKNYTDLTGKVVVITGAGSGAGVEIAKVFSNTGCKLALTYNKSDNGAISLAKEIAQKNVEVKIYHLDQSDNDSIQKSIDLIVKDFGKIDVLVNNAGIYPAKPLREIDENDWDNMLDTNTKGVFFLSRRVAELMEEKDGGSIINISSINATNPADSLVHYGISKSAVEMMTKCLAYQFGPKVRVNCIAPGLIYKEGQEKWIPGWRESYSDRSALHRLVYAEEVGKACLFMASDLSSAVTGQILTVDCGVLLAAAFNNNNREIR